MTAVDVRRARVEDAHAIADIHVRAWNAAYRGLVADSLFERMTLPRKESDWQRVLSNGTSEVFVAEANDRVLGWASLGPCRDTGSAPGTGELFGMYVDPDCWRTGVGRVLWAACEEEMKKKFSSVTLWVLEENPTARSFYERCGFVLEAGTVEKPEWLGANKVRYRLALR